MRRADGATVGWLELHAHPLLDGDTGLVKGVIEFVRDISDRQRIANENLALERQLRHAHRLESLGMLAGGIAHDFNNLLVGVLLNADLVSAELPAHSPAHGDLECIKEAGRHASELASQMLAYSGRSVLEVSPIDLSALVRELTQLLKSTVSCKGILEFDLAPELPAVKADAAQLRQMLLNLVQNSAEALSDPEGRVVITTGTRECDRSFLQSTYVDDDLPAGTYVCLGVTDTGCGMDAETKARSFDPFFTTKPAGRGLGLATLLGIVRGHGGAVAVESDPTRGTTIAILLPSTDEPTVRAESREQGETPWRGSGTLLLVDDNDLIRRSAGQMLQKLGFEVLLAADGHEGVEIFRDHADEIVLVLLDMKMPRMDGEQAFEWLRAIKADVKVILSSGYTEKLATDAFAAKGLSGFLQKPYDLAELQAALRGVLGDQTGETEQ